MSAERRGLGALLDHAAERRGTSIALRVNERDVTYAELHAMVGRGAALLGDRGVAAGSRVVLSAGNSAEFVAALFAVFRLGASVTLLSTAWRQGETDHACAITAPTHIIHDGSGLVDLAAQHPSVPAILIEELASSEAVVAPPAAPVELDDLAVMVFSSGTTGLPKAVRHSHRTLLAGIDHWIEALGLTHRDRLQIATPPFHILGLLNLTAVIRAGASVRLHRRFDLNTVLSAVESDRVTIEMAVAPIAFAIANHPDVERFDLSSLRYIMWGATPVTASVAHTITRRTGVGVLPAYGASELPVLAVNPVHRPDEWRLDSVGLAPTGVELRVVDTETGAVLPAGATGEIQARSESTMLGYLPDDANVDAFQDGWYRTGDVGNIDAAGWVTITDRLKEMIKVKGFQVAPAEVESALLGHAGVADCAVFGVPDEHAGELVVAAVVRSSGCDVTAAELKQLVAASLASYKQIGEVIFVDQIPRLPSGKVLRRELKSSYRS